jgi:hypothetical protein
VLLNYHIGRFVLVSLCVGDLVRLGLSVYFTSYVLNMFRTLIYPSSEACDCAVSVLQAEACNMDTTQTQPHQISNTH